MYTSENVIPLGLVNRKAEDRNSKLLARLEVYDDQVARCCRTSLSQRLGQPEGQKRSAKILEMLGPVLRDLAQRFGGTEVEAPLLDFVRSPQRGGLWHEIEDFAR
jgi:hypothetical protein